MFHILSIVDINIQVRKIAMHYASNMAPNTTHVPLLTKIINFGYIAPQKTTFS